MYLKSFYIGETYAESLSKGLKDHNTLKRINLSRCGLKDDGFIKIMENAPKFLKEIDISN
jgi:hypothetical protein